MKKTWILCIAVMLICVLSVGCARRRVAPLPITAPAATTRPTTAPRATTAPANPNHLTPNYNGYGANETDRGTGTQPRTGTQTNPGTQPRTGTNPVTSPGTGNRTTNPATVPETRR